MKWPTAVVCAGLLGCHPAAPAPQNGNPAGPAADDESQYYLPYPAGRAALVVQGNHGFWSHRHEYAIDFMMPMHAPIAAARAGVVVQVDDSNTETCWLTKDCRGNRVIIQHEDGTRARYWHIEHRGSLVAVNDRVNRGEVIARCGQTGIAFMPHLHFSVVDADNVSMAVRFVEISENGGIPVEFHEYTSANNPP